MERDLGEAVQEIMEKVQKEYKEMQTLNVMVLGKTGVGKSTLINNMFSEKMAETGIGKPITDRIVKIFKEGYPLSIYDTPGFELDGENASSNLINEITSQIKKGLDSNNINEMIHCIWYCVSTTSHRFEDEEINFIRQLHEQITLYKVPIIIVLTQSFNKNEAKELKGIIEKENLPIVNIVPVLAEKYSIDDYTADQYGLDTLSEIMNQIIPESVQKTFVALQKNNIELKKKKAHAIVSGAALAAAAAGATPIPFSDAILLIPEQITMLASITVVYGLPVDKGVLTSIVSGLLGTTGTTIAGKAIVSELIKHIPGAGSIVGGIISASTAATLTTALGEAYIFIMNKISAGEFSIDFLYSEEGKKALKELLVDFLKKSK